MKKSLDAVKVLTDDEESHPFLGFVRYSESIVGIIKGTPPKFSIGIYGEWGTGKTTLMKLVKAKLEDNDILTVWFNAWRYERENQFALVALMKTIAYAMGELPDYQEVKSVLLRGLGIVGKDILRNLATKYVMTNEGMDKLEKNLLPKMELLSKIDKDTIYFDGLTKIENEMEKVLKKNSHSRIVVFIDDLDRCSPKKTLEVLESVKVFLGIRGFVYIIGLSYETISKLISAEYEKSGIRGEQYIKKIIQIPIMIPEWNSQDISGLIENVLSKKLDKQYSDIIIQNKDLISTAIESNPREVKGFINNFIVANEIFSANRVQPMELLVVQALRIRWNTFYRYLSSSKQFREVIKLSLPLSYNDRVKLFNSEQIKRDIEQTTEEITTLQKEVEKLPEDSRKYLGKIDYELWNFLDKQKVTIFGIQGWEIYRHAVESVKDIHYIYEEFRNGYRAGAIKGQHDVTAFKNGQLSELSGSSAPPCPLPGNVEYCKGWKEGYMDQVVYQLD